ncbi:hypothetical protein SH203_01858 [Brevundimonas sp. SH203]|uniref:hypothetical protein n=1 Tax=Brevundimonas sp. SH203 TaxID=345167 RepID=UPI0009C75BBD|nr:hypothetical protein [Brevundimonas sp. SH203]GAW41452.1 hypothetical protein SH203_01858 [Brevundimonas sp. SH203]
MEPTFMSFLAIVLAVKILVTAVFMAIPFLTFPAKRLAERIGVTGGGGVFFRLYGVALTALLAGYGSAFPLLAKQEFPWGVVVMGIISNGGAAAILLGAGARRKTAPVALFLLAITAALIAAAINPAWAIGTL